ncbi:PilZ domain-containing protein [Lysobacter sp. GX 14042]|uniref:PilZ domain-containing protein n=1 Tax=Lysobacter sp. GX 14042 TaxID=2907155 RepID=UPI001F252C54|nr:PilZ domain-containing protein [Lysobacter sp. GX 14042]MCE7031969.1 PilZ domain-containing protein [Lysobacter sp. GX 14042]
MNAAAGHAAVFGDSLACGELRPAAFVAGSGDAETSRLACLRSEALLRAIAVVEDSHGREEPEERGLHDLAVQRIEAKLDLLTALVAGLASRHADADPVRPLEWSAHGACLVLGDDPPGVTAGQPGMLRVRPCDWLPETLELPARVVGSDRDDGLHRLWLRFSGHTPALTAALERHLFRIHRRAVAERRQPR